MPGPLPKPPGQAARRNADSQYHDVTPGTSTVPPMPMLDTGDSDVVEQATLYWKAIWSDLGEMFLNSDRFAIARMCVLHARVALGQRVGAQLQAELRQLEVMFGVSPYGRRRLNYEVKNATGLDPADAAPNVDEVARQRERRAALTG